MNEKARTETAKGKKTKFYKLDHKKHGVGGLTTVWPKRRKQDKKATHADLYTVVFFPKVEGIGKAGIHYWRTAETLSQSPDAAKVKFMDGIKQGEKWETYAEAGHRVRKVRVTDLGDA